MNPIVIEHRGDDFYVSDFGTSGRAARLWKAGTVDGHPGTFSVADARFNPIVGLAFADNALVALETFPIDNPFAPNTSRAVRRKADGSHTVIANGMKFAIGLTRGPDGALYASTTAYGLENDPNVPDVRKAVGIGKIVRLRSRDLHQAGRRDRTRELLNPVHTSVAQFARAARASRAHFTDSPRSLPAQRALPSRRARETFVRPYGPAGASMAACRPTSRRGGWPMEMDDVFHQIASSGVRARVVHTPATFVSAEA